MVAHLAPGRRASVDLAAWSELSNKFGAFHNEMLEHLREEVSSLARKHCSLRAACSGTISRCQGLDGCGLSLLPKGRQLAYL